MKAAVLYGNYDLRYEDYPEPEIRPGCVKVRVCACGICGSDIPRITASGAHYYPIVLGHEFSGFITEVGEGVDTLKKGDHVAAVPLIPCMKCRDCEQGHYSQCKNYTFIGSRIQGGYGDYVVLPARNALKIDPSIPYEQGALFEPSTVALHGIRCAGYQGGKTVAVLGGGTIGLFTLQWARILGAKTIVVFGRSKQHLDVALRLGADAVISTLDEDFMEQAMAWTDGIGFDYVFEAAGSPVTMKLAFELAGNHAQICMIGTPTKSVEFSMREWELMNRKEFHVTGSWMSGSAPFPGDEWKLTAECFANGKLKYDPALFHCQIPIQNTDQIVSVLRDRSSIKGRVLILNKPEE